MPQENICSTITIGGVEFREGDLFTIEGLNDGKPYRVVKENSKTLITIKPFSFWFRLWIRIWIRPLHAWRWSDWMPAIYYHEKEVIEYYQQRIDELFQ